MRPRTAVIPVAGLGTRFLPATKVMPKEMLTVVDKPLIQYAVEETVAAGIEKIIFVTGRGKSVLADHFDRAPELLDNLQAKGKTSLMHQVNDLVPKTGSLLFTRQNDPLGLGHAVWCARQLVGDEPFVVILPDDLVWTDSNTDPVLKQMCDRFEQVDGSMVAVMAVPDQETNKYGILDPKNGSELSNQLLQAKGVVEKPALGSAPSNLAIIGRYILTPEIFDLLGQKKIGTGGEVQLTDAMALSMKTKPLYGFLFQGTRFDCGDKTGFQKANLALALERPELRAELFPFLKEQIARWSTSLKISNQ